MGMASGDPSASQTILELIKKKRGRGRPLGSSNKKVRRDENSTRRDPSSAFEHAIAKLTGSIVRSIRCIKCKMPGHNKCSCSSVPSKEIEHANDTETEVDDDENDYEEYGAAERTPPPEAPPSAQEKEFEDVPRDAIQI